MIGGGISGLATAYYLQKLRPDAKVLLFEQRKRAGGNIHTEFERGFVVDAGPDSFLRSKPAALELCKELGLEGELVGARADARGVHVVQDGALAPLPEGLVMGAPTRLGPLLESSLLSLPGKLRMAAELVLPSGHGRAAGECANADESIADFLARRFGPEAAQGFVAPLLAGIYAGDAQKLSMLATFPMLAELERRFGSVIAGLIHAHVARPGEPAAVGLPARLEVARRWLSAPPGAPPGSPFVSFRRGMGTLVAALMTRLAPDSLHLGQPVRSLENDAVARTWTVRTASACHRVDAVVIAAPAHVAAAIVPSPPLARELGKIRYASTATVFLGFDERNLQRPLSGQGLVVPPGEGGILAATWVSNKWEGRAPSGTALVRAFLGGARGGIDVNRRSDADLLDVTRFELERLVGPLGPATIARVYRHPAANPQPVVGHRDVVGRIRALLPESPGLALTGAAYDGVGIPDCIRQGETTARELARTL